MIPLDLETKHPQNLQERMVKKPYPNGAVQCMIGFPTYFQPSFQIKRYCTTFLGLFTTVFHHFKAQDVESTDQRGIATNHPGCATVVPFGVLKSG
jgi:hypothetical protein